MEKSIGVLVLATAVVLTGCSSQAPKTVVLHTETHKAVEYVVIPHEDDEWEAWSRVEFDPSTYKVFVVLGNGEQTVFCDAYPAGFQPELGEVAPTPAPGGRFTPGCAQARTSSWLRFFGKMSKTDPSIPGSFGPEQQSRPFLGNVCRVDSLTGTGCTSHDTRANIWVDTQGRGELIQWNLGEGDETADEIQWAIQTTLSNSAELGVPKLPVKELVGGYANGTDASCFEYKNVDHLALHTALARGGYGVRVLMAGCTGTSNQATSASMTTAFLLGPNGERLGAHNQEYGWLHEDSYPLSWWDQSDLFQGAQHFEVVPDAAILSN